MGAGVGAGVALLVLGAFALEAQQPAVLTFEGFATGGPGQGGQVRLTTQYAGVTFNAPWVLDYSQGLAIPGFAHSGSRALVLCYAIEFCTDTTFQLTFAAPQQRVKVWAGVAAQRRGPVPVLLVARDASGRILGRSVAVIDAGVPRRIQTPLEVRLESNQISTITIAAQGVFASDFAIDDVEFARVPPTPAPPPVSAAPIRVPDVRGRTLETAARILRRAGLQLGMRGDIRAAGTVGSVAAQHPNPGTPAKRGDPVNVDLIIGPPLAPRLPTAAWLVPVLLALGAAVAVVIRTIKTRKGRGRSPIPRVEPRLASSGLDRQQATFTQAAPSGLEIRLTIRPESLRSWRHDG